MKLSQPNITEAEIEAVADCLREGHLATGVPTQGHSCAAEKGRAGSFVHLGALLVAQ